MSRRDQIALDPIELDALFDECRVAVVSTNGPRGWPHSMPLWYVPRDGELWVWTYGKSQKVRNLERDLRTTILIETGDRYEELRGVMIEAEAEIHTDFDTVLGFAEEMTLRYSDSLDEIDQDVRATLEKQAPKRVAIHLRPVQTASWDHRKLGGSY